MRCRIYRFLYRLIPLKINRDFLIRNHFHSCEKCKEEFYMDNFPEMIGINISNLNFSEKLFTDIKKKVEGVKTYQDDDGRINRNKTKKFYKRYFRWQWAAAVSALFILLLTIPNMLLKRKVNPIETKREMLVQNQTITIESIESEHQPAEVVYFQTEHKNRLIVWVQKRK